MHLRPRTAVGSFLAGVVCIGRLSVHMLMELAISIVVFRCAIVIYLFPFRVTNQQDKL